MSTTRSIDFAALGLRDALDLAILVEEEAAERYEEFTDQMVKHHNEEAAAFFRFMRLNEQRHGRQLSAKRSELFGASAREVTRAMLFDVEAPDYDEVRAFMSQRAALETALRAEQKAHAFFVAALEVVTDPEGRALLADLREEEVLHQELVQKELDKLGPDGLLTGDDVADEPVPQ
jgi:rubrerythrin